MNLSDAKEVVKDFGFKPDLRKRGHKILMNLSDKMVDNEFIMIYDVKEFIHNIINSWSGLRSRTAGQQKVIDVFVKNIKEEAGGDLI